MSNEILAIMILTGGILGLVGFVVSLICVAMVVGFLRSTHSVQYLPFENTEKGEEIPDAAKIAAENDAALMNKVGKKKKEAPTVVEPLDSAIEQINHSDIKF
jgi:hypothetical protein